MNYRVNETGKKESATVSDSYRSPFLLNELINAMPEAVIMADPDFNITGLNPVAESIYGLSLKDAAGKSLLNLIRFEIITTPLSDAIRQLFDCGFWCGEVIYYTPKKQKLYFDSRCTLIKDEQGNVTSIVLVNNNISEKIRQQRKLLQVEKKYETVVESLSEGVVVIRKDGTISTANKKAIEILGLTKEEATGKVVASPVWKAVKEDNSVFPLEEFPAMVTLTTGMEKTDVIMGIELKDKTRKWLSINSRAIYKEGNKLPDAVIASFKDITAIKKAGEQLKESEIIFSTFINNSQTANWIYDEDGYILLANEVFDKITAIPGGSRGKHILEIFPKQLGEKILERNRLFLKEGKPSISENRIPLADGTVKDFVSYLFLVEIPGKKRLIGGQAIDATLQKNALEKLQESEVLFRSFMTHSHNLGWVYDKDGYLIYANPVLMETVGLSELSIGKNICEITNRRVAAAIIEKNKRVLETGDVIISEDRYVDSKGETRYFIAHYFLLTFGDGKKFVGGHSVDITERKKIEAQLINEQIQKQKQINKATLFAQEEERNRISLELHDNVNQLLMSSKLHIGAAKKATDNQAELLDKATEYLLLAVEEIRSLSKSLNSSVVSIVGLKSSIADIARNLEQLNEIEISLDIADDIIENLSSDQQLMLYRIVQEQSNNIIKYASASTVSISLKKINRYCQLTITDNGIGFNQDTNTPKGIGLKNICNRVDAFNGIAKIETSPGNGCKLSIRFPLAG